MDLFVTTYLVNWRIGPMCMLPGFTLGGGNTTLKPDCRTWKLVLGLSGKQNIWASYEKTDVWVYDYCSCRDFWRVFAFCCGSSLFRNRILRKDSIRVPLGRVNCCSKSVWQDRVSILLGLHRPFVYRLRLSEGWPYACPQSWWSWSPLLGGDHKSAGQPIGYKSGKRPFLKNLHASHLLTQAGPRMEVF